MPSDLTLRYRWEIPLASAPSALWPFIADTDRFNRETGVPVVHRAPVPSTLTTRLSLRFLGQTIEWDEEPFEWEEHKRFSIRRRYLNGPFSRLDVVASLHPAAHGGSVAVYEVEVEPRSLLGRLVAPIRIGFAARRAVIRAFRHYDVEAMAQRDSTGRSNGARTPVQAHTEPPPHLERFVRPLVQAGGDARSVACLLSAVAHDHESTLARMRPYELADAWSTPRRPTLLLMLHATRLGLLDLRWDLMCPLCRNGKSFASSLDNLQIRGVHCDACHIDITADLDRLIELSFRPNPAIRRIESLEYCIGGPRVTPHIACQQMLRPGEERVMALSLAPGIYRVRTKTGEDPEIDRGSTLLHADRSATNAAPEEVLVRPMESGASEAFAGLSPTIRLLNEGKRPRLFMIERLTWADDAATASDVFSMQDFRDLFSSEAIRPGEQVGVGHITLLFTDLKDSTRLYRDVGDARAFGTVLAHFDVLKEIVAREQGAIVKTMGDAIMAVFSTPRGAVHAALAMHDALRDRATLGPGFTRTAVRAETSALILKAAVHVGPCIAVNLNNRLDYFGSTANIGARLVALSAGNDVIVSRQALDEAEAEGPLDRAATRSTIECSLKGLEEGAIRAVRLTPAPVARG